MSYPTRYAYCTVVKYRYRTYVKRYDLKLGYAREYGVGPSVSVQRSTELLIERGLAIAQRHRSTV